MDYTEKDQQRKIINQIWNTLKQKGYTDIEMTYGQVMDDFWVTLKGPGIYLDIERQFYQNDAFQAMLEEIERRL